MSFWSRLFNWKSFFSNMVLGVLEGAVLEAKKEVDDRCTCAIKRNPKCATHLWADRNK